MSDDLSTDELLALGLSAAQLGELDLAQKVADRLAGLAAENPNNTNLNLVSMEVNALTMYKRGEKQNAVSMLLKAVEMAESQSPPRGAASPLKPVHELAGDVFLDMGEHKRAAELYEASLGRMANRPRALLGAGRSYAGLGDSYNARQRYQDFYALWQDGGIAEVSEAKGYLGI